MHSPAPVQGSEKLVPLLVSHINLTVIQEAGLRALESRSEPWGDAPLVLLALMGPESSFLN